MVGITLHRQERHHQEVRDSIKVTHAVQGPETSETKLGVPSSETSENIYPHHTSALIESHVEDGNTIRPPPCPGPEGGRELLIREGSPGWPVPTCSSLLRAEFVNGRLGRGSWQGGRIVKQKYPLGYSLRVTWTGSVPHLKARASLKGPFPHDSLALVLVPCPPLIPLAEGGRQSAVPAPPTVPPLAVSVDPPQASLERLFINLLGYPHLSVPSVNGRGWGRKEWKRSKVRRMVFADPDGEKDAKLGPFHKDTYLGASPNSSSLEEGPSSNVAAVCSLPSPPTPAWRVVISMRHRLLAQRGPSRRS